MAVDSYIEGKNALLEAIKGEGTIDSPAEYVPIRCMTSVEFYCDTELVERATVGMGGFRDYRTGMGEWGIRGNGVSSIALPTDPAYGIFDLMTEQLRRNGLDIRLSFEDNNGNLQVITGHVLIPHTGITAPYDAFSEDDFELKGGGAFALSTSFIDPISISDVKKVEYTAAGGEQAITIPETINREILAVFRSGIGAQTLVSGTPLSNQVTHNATTGEFLFGSELSPSEWVLILYK